VLCKHEVVGSIPSGSTIAARLIVVLFGGKVLVFAVVALCRHGLLFVIVKSVLSGLPRAGFLGVSPWKMCGSGLSQLCLELDRPRPGQNEQAGLYLPDVSAAERASLMEAIKCLKGVQWMPWHREAMKDVVRCDKPWGGANNL
jgi:hypothetical protein